MVSERAYSYYLSRKKYKEKKDEEEGDFSILNEIAKLKGFKGGKIGERRIEPIEQYAEFLAKELGFKGRKKGEKIEGKIVEADLSPSEEWRDFYRKRGKTGNPYWELIPEGEYEKSLEILKRKWTADHQKFIAFCSELEKDIRSWFEKTKKTEAALSIEDAFKHLEEYHMTHKESMNIYNRDDLILGLKYCFTEKGIDISTRKMKTHIDEPYKTYIIFKQI